MTDYLTLADVLAIHADQIRRYGGSEGLRDLGLLDAALNRPKSGYYKDLLQEAAALWESLSQNHPFIDGNKRTAFAAVRTFLGINGVRLTADQDVAYDELIGLYEAHSMNFLSIERWLRANSVQKPNS